MTHGNFVIVRFSIGYQGESEVHRSRFSPRIYLFSPTLATWIFFLHIIGFSPDCMSLVSLRAHLLKCFTVLGTCIHDHWTSICTSVIQISLMNLFYTMFIKKVSALNVLISFPYKTNLTCLFCSSNSMNYYTYLMQITYTL